MIGDNVTTASNRSRGGYARASRSEQAANLMALAWPLVDIPESGPGAYPIPLSDNFWGARRHAGLDIPARRGTRIQAPISGTVIRARRGEEEGNYVAVQDSAGRKHYFMHMDRPSPLAVGDRVVARTTTLGFVGSTGRSDGYHLHYAIILPNGHALDPYDSLLIAKETEHPIGVEGFRLRRPRIGETPTQWNLLNDRMRSILDESQAFVWAPELLETVPDPSEMRSNLRRARETAQANQRTLATAFRMHRDQGNYQAASGIVATMRSTWNSFKAFAARFAARSQSTVEENFARNATAAADNAAAAAGEAISSIGTGVMLLGALAIVAVANSNGSPVRSRRR